MNFSRPPPPQGPPPSYAFVTRVYRRNLRPVVLVFASLSALWSLFSAIGFFRSIGIDKSQNFQKLATISIVAGVLYMVIFACEVFGFFAAITQRLPLIRIYALASTLAALIVFATGLLRVVIHFTDKNDLITECTNLSTGDEIVYRFGLFGPIRTDRLSQADANIWCRRAWDRDSWAEIVSLLITLFLGVMFAVVAFAYYRQTLDPASPANASRAPSNQVRVDLPTYYNPPYNASVPNLGYNQPYGYGSYAPPQGPPPAHRDDAFVPPNDSKPPGYTGNGRPDADDKENPFADFDGPSRPGHDGRDPFR